MTRAKSTNAFNSEEIEKTKLTGRISVRHELVSTSTDATPNMRLDSTVI